MKELPRGTVTFLFTDIEGSTRLLKGLGDGYADALAEHRRLLRETFQAHGGVEVDTQGDALFYAFARADDAVRAAADGQKRLLAGPVSVRMGLHTGEPRVTDEGYVGLDVHTGARVAACAHGGQVVLTSRTRELAGETLEFLDLGEHRLKDLQEAVWLCQVGTDRFPPLRSRSNTNLPTPASSFLGREWELREASELIRQARLLTVSGPGGTGKTRFAIELASRQLDDFPNGTFWIPLASLRDPAVVLDEAANAIGAKESLAAHIGQKRMLLVLDNFEQVVDAAPTLPHLLSECPNLRLLVTSRETLRVEGEVEYGLPPLAEEEGVDLFCARARVEPSAVVRELCRRLDSLPLAIELAAARTKALAPEELLERLSRRLDILRAGRDAESRHETLRATIGWSHDLLGPAEQRLFSNLSAFAGGCTFEAAEEVCGADLDTLQALLDKSLVRRTSDRFWMLETIREFALETRVDQGDESSIRERHMRYFVRFAEEAYPHLEGPEQGVWLDRVDPEHDNIRAALAHARNLGDREIELRLAVAVAPFRLKRGYLSEALLSLEEVLYVPGHSELRAIAFHHAGWAASFQGRSVDAETFLAEGLALARELGDSQLIARQLLTLAGIVSDRDEQEAQTLYDELLEFIAAHPEERFPRALLNLADFAIRRGEYESARDFSAQSIALSRPAGDPWGLALAISNHGLALLGLRLAEEALEDFREALRLMESVQDPHAIATMLSLVAAATAERGEADRAVRLLAIAELMLEEMMLELPGLEADIHEHTVARMRAECSEFDSEWCRGRSLTREEAIAEALSDGG